VNAEGGSAPRSRSKNRSSSRSRHQVPQQSMVAV
jgi:hypothetical protein